MLETCVNAPQAACLQKPALLHIRVSLVMQHLKTLSVEWQLYSFITSSYKVLVNFILATVVLGILVLLPDFRQTASYISFVCSGNSIWRECLLIRAGQAALASQHYSIIKVFTLLISQGHKALSYGFDLATKCGWDVFLVCRKTIFYTNALKMIMKLRQHGKQKSCPSVCLNYTLKQYT